MIVVRFWVLAGVCQQRCSPPLNHVPMYLVLNYLGTWLSNQIRTMRIAALSSISRIWRIRLHSTHAPTAMRQSQGQNSHFADSHVLMPAVRTQTLQVRRNHPYQSVDTSPIYTPIHSYTMCWWRWQRLSWLLRIWVRPFSWILYYTISVCFVLELGYVEAMMDPINNDDAFSTSSPLRWLILHWLLYCTMSWCVLYL